MEQAGHYAILEINRGQQASGLGDAFWYVTRRVVAVLALLIFTYGLLAAEVELAKIEHVTEPVALTW